MTSKIVHNSYVSRKDSLAKKVLSSKRFLAQKREAFGVIKQDQPEPLRNTEIANINTNTKPDDTPRSQKAVAMKADREPASKTALLKTAYKMLQQAERDLAEKEARIQALQEILTVDELTGLTNRRGFYRSFEGELDRTNRGENEGGLLIMIDLDYFKDINDRFGHLAGDEALRTVGQFLRSTTRPMDIAARLGGDEFIVLMPNTNIGKAMQRARKIGNALNDLTFEWKGQVVRIHASIGLKEYAQGDTINSIIEQADRGLYQNKEMRRDSSVRSSRQRAETR
ncbi:MAG: GGDEF domain-containing protein [Alphaproteobacteria bacterium]